MNGLLLMESDLRNGFDGLLAADAFASAFSSFMFDEEAVCSSGTFSSALGAPPPKRALEAEVEVKPKGVFLGSADEEDAPGAALLPKRLPDGA
jgi:hypothetical protein